MTWVTAALVLSTWTAEGDQLRPTVVTLTPSGRAVRPEEALELRLDRPLLRSIGTLGVIIDRTDWSALFEATPTGAIYRPSTLRLSAGRHVVRVYRVSANAWEPLAEITLRVDGGSIGASTASSIHPTVDLANNGQVSEGHRPSTRPPERATFQDFSAHAGLQATTTRAGWASAAQINILGVSYRKDAIRFNQEQDAAPLVDLADYTLNAERPGVGLSLGHVSFGTNRHLFDNTSTRGALARVRVGSRTDLALAALHGTPIVGWDNILGLAQPTHRVLGGTFGVELLAKRPGGLRLETSVLDGRLKPLTSVNFARVDDAEQSRGVGLRVVANDTGRRVQLDGGYSRSSFTNPADPLLARGAAVVQVMPETRDARYLDASFAVIQRKTIMAMPANLTAVFRHERVEPLFGSVTANLRSDIQQNGLSIDGSLGPATVRAAHNRAHDNLDAIASILTTFTRTTEIAAVVPLAQMSSRPHALRWPSFTYAFTQVQQEGDTTPVNGGFVTRAQVPDQQTTDQAFGVEWRGTRFAAGYRLERTYQDNRQIGRQNTDLGHVTHTMTLELNVGPAAELHVDLGVERAHNQELASRDLTRRWGVIGQWRPTTRLAVSVLASTFALNERTSSTHASDANVNVQIAHSVPIDRRTSNRRQAQIFVRYARRSELRIDRNVAIDQGQRIWTLNTGVNLKLF